MKLPAVHMGIAGRSAAAGVLSAAIFTAACGSSSGQPTAGEPGSLLTAAQCSANRAAGTITYVSPFGFDASAGIIDVFAAQKLGYFKKMCLKVDFVTNSFQPTELVSSGRAAVTNIGSAADDLVQAANGANVMAVATYGDVSDYAILTQAGITSLKQLQGKTFGYHTAIPVSVLEMLSAAGAELAKIHLVNTQDYNPNQLIQGHVNGLQAYQSNEPITLTAEKLKFNEFTPGQFDVKGTFNVQIFNKGFLSRHRAAAADFMRAELHAFYYCVAHMSACISIEQDYARAAGAEYLVPHESAVWKLEAGLATGHTLPGMGVGVETEAEWQPEAVALQRFGILKSVPHLREWEDTSLVASLYHGNNLVWP